MGSGKSLELTARLISKQELQSTLAMARDF